MGCTLVAKVKMPAPLAHRANTTRPAEAVMPLPAKIALQGDTVQLNRTSNCKIACFVPLAYLVTKWVPHQVVPISHVREENIMMKLELPMTTIASTAIGVPLVRGWA